MKVIYYLIKNNKAYVCSLNEDELRQYRGDFTTPGKESPYRNRSIEENLDLFNRMKPYIYGLVEEISVNQGETGSLDRKSVV